MMRGSSGRTVCLSLLFLLALSQGALADTAPTAEDSWLDEGWSVAGFAGVLTENNSSDIFFGFDWDTDAGVAGLAIDKELVSWGERAALEAEVHAVRRFSGQSLWEFAGLFLFRWHDLPWDDAVNIGLAAGYGVSHATEIPSEVRSDNPDLSRTLGVLVAEVEVGPPTPSPWSGFLRYQHRSSAFGVFGDGGQADEGTFFALGVRRRF